MAHYRERRTGRGKSEQQEKEIRVSADELALLRSAYAKVDKAAEAFRHATAGRDFMLRELWTKYELGGYDEIDHTTGLVRRDVRRPATEKK
jgi:hypothetical protein